jgi:hypothetical protein
MYKGIRKRKRENLQGVKTTCQKLIACNRLAIFLHVGNRPLAIGWLQWWEVCYEGVEVEK